MYEEIMKQTLLMEYRLIEAEARGPRSGPSYM